MTRFGYLGPEGTFTQMALLSWRPATSAEHVPFGSVDAALTAVREREIDAAVVPIENSVEGGVSATLDALASGAPLSVTGEVLVPITFVIAAREGVELADVRAIGTHSHAWAQVRGWAQQHAPEAGYVATLSTASAAADLAAGGAPFDAAVCAPVAAHNHGLQVLAHDIGDLSSAVTRFVVVSRPEWLPTPTGFDKTTVVLYQRSDRAGGLLELLEQLAARGINMTRLESRPTKESMGSYCFSIDLEGHVADARVGEALMSLHRVCAEVRFVGSYPAANGQAVSVDPLTSDTAFAEASSWLESLRHPGR
ncbi:MULTISPECIES: prephenate dehydratase [Janibacter]|uniref:Prephenate dehydratase n=1 Tax=Janibacter melonis TaxID=262209 RepID=A0A5P8FJQ1_9MICO|nr:prephenate dehydratase [Janibacter melonis]MCB5992049.1 prephenate dehydratase [Janibacter melonis]MCM3556735.1 prephenate dehydratase [Janibacter melonis]QFQ29072.2 prephenate dehydratase [Janibacter melonis]